MNSQSVSLNSSISRRDPQEDKQYPFSSRRLRCNLFVTSSFSASYSSPPFPPWFLNWQQTLLSLMILFSMLPLRRFKLVTVWTCSHAFAASLANNNQWKQCFKILWCGKEWSGDEEAMGDTEHNGAVFGRTYIWYEGVLAEPYIVTNSPFAMPDRKHDEC
jgi:hypothetical protein